MIRLLSIPALLAVFVFGQESTIHEAGHTSTSCKNGGACLLATARDGQTLTVQGKVRSEPHDMAFDIPGCGQTVLLTFAGDKDNQVGGTELRRDEELRRFQKYTSSVYKSTGKNVCLQCSEYGDVEAELTGKLEIASMPPGATRDRAGFIRDQSGKIIGQFGWGHPIPFASYRLMIQSGLAHKQRPASCPDLSLVMEPITAVALMSARRISKLPRSNQTGPKKPPLAAGSG